MAREVPFVIKSHAKELNLGGSGDGVPSKGYLRDSPWSPVVRHVEELRLHRLETYPPLLIPPMQAVKACGNVLNGVGCSCRRAENRIHCGVVCIVAHSKKVGPRILPCGTPDAILNGKETCLFTITLSATQVISKPSQKFSAEDIVFCFALYRRPMWKTPSNVPWMSTAKTRTQPLPPRRMPEPTHVAVLLAGQLCEFHAILPGGEEMMTLQVIRHLAVYHTFHDFGDNAEQGNTVVVIWLKAARFL